MSPLLSRRALLVLRATVAVCLLVDAIVHLRLSSGYQLAQPAGIGEGNLFRIEAVFAVLAAAYVVARGSRASFLVAAAVGLSACAAVLLSRYVQVPALGPIPSMYEPVWFFQKSLSAVAEGVGGLLALLGAATSSSASASESRSPRVRPTT